MIPYQCDQNGDIRLTYTQSSLLWLRYMYQRSSESRTNGQPGQDYLVWRYKEQDDEKILGFAICDGVGGSFCGEVAAQYLGNKLINDFIFPVGYTLERLSISEVKEETINYLLKWKEAGHNEVEKRPLPADIPPMLKQALEQQRQYGSEAVFVCGRLVLRDDKAKLILIWMGDTQVLLFDKAGQPVDVGGRWSNTDRWSTKTGIKGQVQAWVGDVKTFNIKRIIAFSDGLNSIANSIYHLTNTEVRREALRLLEQPSSDDISLIDITLFEAPLIWIDTTANETLAAPDISFDAASNQVQWTPVPNADRYILTETKSKRELYRGPETYYSLAQEKPGVYSWQVYACNVDKGLQGQPSKEVQVEIPITRISSNPPGLITPQGRLENPRRPQIETIPRASLQSPKFIAGMKLVCNINDSITLTWESVPNANRYELLSYRNSLLAENNLEPEIKDIGSNLFTEIILDEKRTFYFRVKAIAESQESISDVLMVLVEEKQLPLQAPRIKPIDPVVFGAEYYIRWSEVSEAQQYQLGVFKPDNPVNANTPIKAPEEKIVWFNLTRRREESFFAGNKEENLFYAVRAWNKKQPGELSNWQRVQIISPELAKPTLRLEMDTAGIQRLIWEPVAVAEGYQLEERAKQGTSWLPWAKRKKISQTEKTAYRLPEKPGFYQYRLQAYNDNGFSEWSQSVEFDNRDVLPSNASNSTLVIKLEPDVQLINDEYIFTWNNIYSNVGGYYLFVSQTEDFSTKKTVYCPQNSRRVPARDLFPGKIFVQVSAKTKEAEDLYSNVISTVVKLQKPIWFAPHQEDVVNNQLSIILNWSKSEGSEIYIVAVNQEKHFQAEDNSLKISLTRGDYVFWVKAVGKNRQLEYSEWSNDLQICILPDRNNLKLQLIKY